MSDVQKWHWIEWSDEYPPLKHFWHWYFRRSCRFSISVPRKISIICRCSMQLGDASFILITNTPFYSSKNLLLIKMIVMRIILPSEPLLTWETWWVWRQRVAILFIQDSYLLRNIILYWIIFIFRYFFRIIKSLLHFAQW